MKSAEEWLKRADVGDGTIAAFDEQDIEAIQADAEHSGYERGVREAAEKVNDYNSGKRLIEIINKTVAMLRSGMLNPETKRLLPSSPFSKPNRRTNP